MTFDVFQEILMSEQNILPKVLVVIKMLSGACEMSLSGVACLLAEQ